MGNQGLLSAQQVAFAIGVSVPTLNMWYRYKKENPDSEYSEMLPDYIQATSRQTRYWNMSDIDALIKFKNSIPHGRNGIMGTVTQKYVAK